MAFYYLLVQPNVDLVVLPSDATRTMCVPDIFLTTVELHKKVHVGEVASRVSPDFTSASAGSCRRRSFAFSLARAHVPCYAVSIASSTYT